jgi:hypothetical protein
MTATEKRGLAPRGIVIGLLRMLTLSQKAWDSKPSTSANIYAQTEHCAFSIHIPHSLLPNLENVLIVASQNNPSFSSPGYISTGADAAIAPPF